MVHATPPKTQRHPDPPAQAIIAVAARMGLGPFVPSLPANLPLEKEDPIAMADVTLALIGRASAASGETDARL